MAKRDDVNVKQLLDFRPSKDSTLEIEQFL